MSGGIRIPVSASLDAGDVSKAIAEFEARFNALGAKIAAANKVTFDPIKGSSTRSCAQARGRLQIAAQGQRATSASARSRRASRVAASWIWTGSGCTPPDRYSAISASSRHSNSSAVLASARRHPTAAVVVADRPMAATAVATATVQASSAVSSVRWPAQASMLWAAAGRVANGALGAGMSGGVMAGLAGLGGGLAALAIGKAVGAVVEKSAPSRSRTLNTTGSRGS